MDVLFNLNPVTSEIYAQVNPDGSKRTFGNTPNSIWAIIQYTILFVALFLAFKCKSREGGVRWDQLILAFLFSPFYIAYRVARPCV